VPKHVNNLTKIYLQRNQQVVTKEESRTIEAPTFKIHKKVSIIEFKK